MAGFLQVQSYVQVLWKEIDPDRTIIYNGAVEAGLTLFGAISAFMAGLIDSTFFEKFNLWILTICSLLEGIFVVVSSYATHVLLAYAMYILFGVLYIFMITMAR
jgi:thiamine transporter 2/3